MSAKKSNLSSEKYGYDMVVSVTQDSLNDTLKNYLSDYNGQELIQVFELDDNDNIQSISYTDFLTSIDNTDIFNIPDKADKANSDVKKVKEKRPEFCFAFKATMGIPENIDPLLAPDIIVLSNDKSSVQYQLYFKEFTVVKMTRGGKWSKFSQEDAKPWIFSFIINLDLREDNTDNTFSSLPKHVRDKVKNLNPDTMFSVQQLYLNLNTAGLSEKTPKIDNIDPASSVDLYNALTKIFLGTYFQTLKKKGDIVLGYGIKPSKFNPQQRKPSITPTDFNFEICPYLDHSGNPMPSNKGLYTLNYLVMTENRRLHPPVQFAWNWIDVSERKNSHGVMSIRREVFANFLKKVLSPALNKISLKPWCKVESRFALKNILYKYNFEVDNNPQQYAYITDSTDKTKILSFSYNPPRAYDEAGLEIGLHGNLGIKSAVQSDVYLIDNIIKIVSTVKVNIHVNCGGAVADGDYVKLRTENKYQISVSDKGDLVVTLIDTDKSFKDESDAVDAGFFSKIASFGQITDLAQNVKNHFMKMKDFMTGFSGDIERILNNTNVWVFPGNKTFVFKNVLFSEHQDLISHITYSDTTSN
ncbi:MAG: hypothetical protein J0I09_07595 [Sphingobacteriia bacterium]|nr:hypothetical protein [Sphingobacteriia bacterium]